MFRNQWYAILDARQVRLGKVIGTTRMGEKLALWRSPEGQLGCAIDQCAHRGAALSHGAVKGEHVCRPFHGFEYNNTGRCQAIPAISTKSEVPKQFFVNAYTIREAYGAIWIYWGHTQPNEIPELPWFENLGDNWAYATYTDHWPVHYSRAIENQLDVVHLPFVHHNTIGRGGKTI